MSDPGVRLYVVVEGQTEEAFVKDVLRPHLEPLAVWAEPIIAETSRSPEGHKKAGGGNWQRWKADIRRLLHSSQANRRVTTLFDLYGLPRDYPRLTEHSKIDDTLRRVQLLEMAMAEEIDDVRFVPYLQRHEFETLVLAGLSELIALLEDRQDRLGWSKLVADLGETAPEDVNDGENTAPSKRLARFIPSYDPPVGKKTAGNGKSVYGPAVTQSLGLAALREKCPRFSAWVSKLETLNR